MSVWLVTSGRVLLHFPKTTCSASYIAYATTARIVDNVVALVSWFAGDLNLLHVSGGMRLGLEVAVAKIA